MATPPSNPAPDDPTPAPPDYPKATIDLSVALRTALTGKGVDAGPHILAGHLSFGSSPRSTGIS